MHRHPRLALRHNERRVLTRACVALSLQVKRLLKPVYEAKVITKEVYKTALEAIVEHAAATGTIEVSPLGPSGPTWVVWWG